MGGAYPFRLVFGVSPLETSWQVSASLCSRNSVPESSAQREIEYEHARVNCDVLPASAGDGDERIHVGWPTL